MKEYEVLMSCMYQNDFTLAQKSCIKSDLLIVNQSDKSGEDTVEAGGYKWRMISTFDRGLSKSRNTALDNASGEICQLCDDDCILESNHKDIVLNAYAELPDADVIVFNVKRINYSMKKTYYKIQSIREAPKFRNYGSPMITFRLASIKKHDIRFNEMFGSGSKFGGGEDSLFLTDIRRAGMKIYEYPATIATVDYARSTSMWFHGYTNKYFYNIGVYHQYTKPNKMFLNLIWGLYSCFKLRKERINPFRILYWRFAGALGFKHGMKTYEEYIENKK